MPGMMMAMMEHYPNAALKHISMGMMRVTSILSVTGCVVKGRTTTNSKGRGADLGANGNVISAAYDSNSSTLGSTFSSCEAPPLAYAGCNSSRCFLCLVG